MHAQLDLGCQVPFEKLQSWLVPYPAGVLQWREARRCLPFFFFSVVKREHAADVKDVFFRLLHAKMHERKGRSHKYSPKFQRQLILRYLVDCKTEAGSSMLMDGFLQQVVLPFSSTGAPPTINTPAGAEPSRNRSRRGSSCSSTGG